MSAQRYNARTAEVHWQRQWDRHNMSAAGDANPAAAELRCAPGAVRLDLVRNCAIADVVARYRRACPRTGRDQSGPASFPVAAGQAAMARAVLRSLGVGFDWRDATASCDPGGETPVADRPASPTAAIDPAGVIDAYGADATRWFLLSDSPPDRAVMWNGPGIRGAWRFVQRMWRLINTAVKFSAAAPATRPVAFSGEAVELRTTAHRALARVSANLERSRFNLCVADINGFARTLAAVVADASGPASPDLKFAAREAADILVQLFYPMMPHLAEECWAALGHQSLVATRSWPAFEADLLVDRTVTLAVHLNGRKRGDVVVAHDAGTGDIEAAVLALDVIGRALAGRVPRKVIIVPQRIVNVVA